MRLAVVTTSLIFVAASGANGVLLDTKTVPASAALGGKTVDAEFSTAAAWLVSKLHVSQMAIVLVFSALSLQGSLPPGTFPCGGRIVSPITRICFYFVETRDLEQGLGRFDLLDGPHVGFVAAAMIWDEDLLAAMQIPLDELFDELPSFTRVLLSKQVELAHMEEGARLLRPFPHQRVEDSPAHSEPWAFSGLIRPMQVTMQIAPATRQLSSADFVVGFCEAHFDRDAGDDEMSGGIDSSLMLCVVVWGYMWSEAALLPQCVHARVGRLAISNTLPFGTVALGCALVRIEDLDCATRSNRSSESECPLLPVEAGTVANWFPGFAARHPESPGSPTPTSGLRMIGGLRLSHPGGRRDIYGIDGMKLSVDGSTWIHALRWSGFHEESYYKKVADQKSILSQYLSIETETTVLEVGCGGLTVGSWLIDILSPYSYTCIDVAPWAPKLVLEAGIRTDTARTDKSMGYPRLMTDISDFTQKHAHIEGSALCEWKAANRGKVDLVFSFTAIPYLTCNMLHTCMDNTYEALKPGGRMLIAVPVEENATIAASTHIREPLVMQYFSRVCNTRDAMQRWAHSHGVAISVGPLHTSDYPSPPRQEMWLLEHEATVSADAVRQGQ